MWHYESMRIKTCSKCKVEKPETDFGRDKKKIDGLKYACKTCRNKENGDRRKANPDSYRKTNLRYARSHKGKALQRANNLRRKFWPKLSNEEAVAEYTRLLVEQNFSCAICELHQSMFKTSLAVDHDHKTGKVRGLLCNRCNRFEIGKHTRESVEKMLAYFKKYE